MIKVNRIDDMNLMEELDGWSCGYERIMGGL